MASAAGARIPTTVGARLKKPLAPFAFLAVLSTVFGPLSSLVSPLLVMVTAYTVAGAVVCLWDCGVAVGWLAALPVLVLDVAGAVFLQPLVDDPLATVAGGGLLVDVFFGSIAPAIQTTQQQQQRERSVANFIKWVWLVPIGGKLVGVVPDFPADSFF